MGVISLQNVTKQFGGQMVLEDVSLELTTGETVGVIGPNGAGKTTLFRLIVGQLLPDVGTVTRSRGLDVGYLPQEPAIGLDNTLHDEVLSVFADVLAMELKLQRLSNQIAEQHDDPDLGAVLKQYEDVNARFLAAGGYAYEQRLNEILGGLGFTEEDRRLPMSALSGGQKCRAALAKLLLQDKTYLLLDEPTNHLDIDAVRWLEKFLAGRHGGAAIISHDRYLLDRLVDRIVEVDRTRLTFYPGDYTNYARVRKLRELTQQRQYEKDRAFIDKERSFIAKHLAGQRTKEAQGRRKRLERRLEAGEFVLDTPKARRDMSLGFDAPFGAREPFDDRAGHAAVRLDEVAKRYDDKLLFENLTLEVPAGRRFGITGPNGTGKTTLLRAIIGEIPVDTGTVETDVKAQIGYYAQDARDLHPEATVLSEIMELRPAWTEASTRSWAARFRFTGDDVYKRVGSLSGGEQSRLRLCKLILETPNVLILDEPTNHLDIPAREALEAALDQFQGTIIAVSHDRYFLDRIADRLLVLRAGRHSLHNGNYSDYIRETEAQAAKAPQPAVPRPGRGRRPAARASGRNQQNPKSRFDRIPFSELEEFIIATETSVADLERRFADPSVYRDGAAVAALRDEFERLKGELAEAHEAWERRA